MRRALTTSIVLAAVAALALSGCSGRTTAASPSGSASSAGFAANSLVGVALPSKTSENWVLAGDLFNTGLTGAGFKADVQYAAATGTVADQQGQIADVSTKGCKVSIKIGRGELGEGGEDRGGGGEFRKR